MNAQADQATPTQAKRKRPIGREKNEYSGHEQWTFQRWAWEFLRRNSDFQAACKQAAGNPVDEQAVAEQFGLKKFVRRQNFR